MCNILTLNSVQSKKRATIGIDQLYLLIVLFFLWPNETDDFIKFNAISNSIL